MKGRILFIILCFISTIQLNAATITVCINGCDYTTISAAVTAANSGDIIDIQDAIHTENNITVNKSLTFQGQGQDMTLLQAAPLPDTALDQIFLIQGTALNVTFKDITLANGVGDGSTGNSNISKGGAVYSSSNGANLVFDKVTLKNNYCISAGGGAYIVDAASVLFMGCIIDGNYTSAAGTWGSLFTGPGIGGGVSIADADNVIFDKCSIINNQASQGGNGIHTFSISNKLSVINCTIANNSSISNANTDYAYGGGILAAGTINIDIINSTIVNNNISPNFSGDGGGVRFSGDLVSQYTWTFKNSIIANNTIYNTNPNDVSGFTDSNFNWIISETLSESFFEASELPSNNNIFTYDSDPNLIENSCGLHTIFRPIYPSEALGNGSSGIGIPSNDICGFPRGSIIDLGSAQKPYNTNLYTQTSGSISSTNGDADLLNTAANGSGISLDGNITLLQDNNLIVQSGHDIRFTEDLHCQSLDVQAGGQLQLDNSNSTTTTLKIDNALTVNGSLQQANNSNASAIRLETNNTGSPFDISGTGTLILGHILMSGSNVTVKQGTSLELKDHLSNDNPALLNNTNSGADFTIEAYATVTAWGDFYLDTNLHSIGSNKGYDVHIYGDLYIGRSSSNPAYDDHNLHILSDDPFGFANPAYQMTIYSGGKLSTTNPILGGNNNSVTPSILEVKDGGILQSSADNPFLSFVSSSSEIILANNSTMIFAGDIQNINADALDNNSFGNVSIGGTSSNKILTGNINIANDLTLQTAGITLGNFDLAMNKNYAAFLGDPFIGLNAARFIRTNGTGVLKIALPSGSSGNNISSGITCPVGNDYFNPVYIYNNGSPDVFSIAVRDEILVNGDSGYPLTSDVVDKTWDISNTSNNGTDIGLFLYWSANQQLTGFDENSCWLSHHDGNQWDILAGSVAGNVNNSTYGNMNFLHRQNITNLSHFSVISAASPTCEDGIQNGNETGIDCGGSYCDPCFSCEAPAQYTASPQSTTSTLISWDEVPGATLYQVWYRVKSTSWAVVGTSNLQRTLNNLSPNKYYQYKLRAKCSDNTWSGFTSVEEFYSSSCDIPTGIASIYLDGNRFRVRWDNSSNLEKGRIKYREVGTSTWLLKGGTPGNNYLYVTDLTPNTTYQYRVRTKCVNGEWSAYSDLYYHSTTIAPRLSSSSFSEDIRISPNPVNDRLNISFGMNTPNNINISIVDVLGKTVLRQNNSYDTGQQTEQVDVSELSRGYYFISIDDGEEIKTIKFIKM